MDEEENIMTISEAAAKMDVSVDTLRYYERIGVLPPVPRKSNGIRNYDATYIEWVALVKMLKASGLSLEHVIEYIELSRQGGDSHEKRKQLLFESKRVLVNKIMELELALREADDLLNNYEKNLLPKTESLVNGFYNQASIAS